MSQDRNKYEVDKMELTKEQNTTLRGGIDDGSSASDDDLVVVLSRVKVKHPTNIVLATIPDEVKKFELPDKMGNNKRMANTRPITTKKGHHGAAKLEPATPTNPAKKRKVTKKSSAGVKKSRSGKKVLSKEEREKVRKHPETYDRSKHVNEGDKQRNAADRGFHLRHNAELKGFYYAASKLVGEIRAKFAADVVTGRDGHIQKMKAKDPDAAAYAERTVPKEIHFGEAPSKGPAAAVLEGASRQGSPHLWTTGPITAGSCTINLVRTTSTEEETEEEGKDKDKDKDQGEDQEVVVEGEVEYTLHCLEDARDLDLDPHSSELDAAARARATRLPESFVERVAANRRLDELTAADKSGGLGGAVVWRATVLDTPLRLLRVDLALASGRRMRLWVDRQLVDVRRDIKTKKERDLVKWSRQRPRLPHYVVECGFLIYESVTGGGEDGEDENGEEEEEDARIRIRLPEQQHQQHQMDVDTDTDRDTDMEDADPLPLAQQQASEKPDSSSSSTSPSAQDERRRQQHQQRLDRIADSSSQHASPHPCPSSSYPMSTSAVCTEIRIHARHLPLATFTERGLANAHASGVFLAHSRVARPLRNALDDFWWERNAAAGADREAWRRVTSAAEEEGKEQGGKGKGKNSGEEGEDRGEGGDGDGEDGEDGGRGLYDALLETGAMRARLGYDRLYVRVHAVADVQGPLNI
ncbi:hypothetical protein F4809DRAFT_640282 [Biscogniauxia mediterranea]|nr:hypothetical protein F4809DRAFT_640282 [Biscogniauxia mediterranea]